MSGEQEKAAKWDRVEEYKAAKERLANLRGQLRTWGETFIGVGESLQKNPDNLDLPSLEKIPTGKDLSNAVAEFKKAMLAYEQVSETLRGLGLEPF
ncbi:MAG: hypothetical protein ABSE82_13380 [Nitrososphaerales archaeon]|jgi:hypothetical protein